MHTGIQSVASNAGGPSIWVCIAVALTLGGICFFCLREGLTLMTMNRTAQTPSWIKAVGGALVLLGLSSVLVVAFGRLQ